MSSKKDKVLKLINKRKKKFKELRTNTSRGMSPNKIVLQYIEDINNARQNSDDVHDFQTALNKATTLLENRLRAFDDDIHINVNWSNSDDWKTMGVNGIHITWSKDYLEQHPDEHEKLNIDLGTLMMDGLFDE